MKINWLKIQDFRGFRNCEITFPKISNIVVFIGVNGAGKSAVLDAMSIILDVLVGDICYRKYTERRTTTNKFNQDDINLNAEKYALDMEFSAKRCEKSSLSKNQLVNTYTPIQT
jgi:predicted ATP-binding protein involved in virulence